MGVSTNGGTQNIWFIREKPIKTDDLGVPPIYGNPHFWTNLFETINNHLQNRFITMLWESDGMYPTICSRFNLPKMGKIWRFPKIGVSQ